MATAVRVTLKTLYRWLFNSMVADKATHKKIERALTKLAQKMPDSVVARARLPI